MKARSRIALLTMVAALAAAWLMFAPLQRTVVCAVVDVATGSLVSIERLQIGRAHTTVWGLHVVRRGEPLFDAARLDLSYRLRDLLPGGTRRFGLVRITLVRPQLTLVRLQDGSFNFSSAPATAAAPAAPSGATTPLRFTAGVRDGEVVLVDEYRLVEAARHQRLDRIDADLSVDSAALTHYVVRGDVESEGRHPLQLVGTIDRTRGFAMHHLTASVLPLTALVNYAINSPAARLFGGVVEHLDVRAYAFGLRDGAASPYHLCGTGELRNGVLLIGGFRLPLLDMRGPIAFFDDGIATTGVNAQLSTMPVRVSGGLYDLRAPQFRLFLHGVGELAQLRSSFAFSTAYPLRGGARIDASVEGPVGDPLVLIAARSPRIWYGPYPLDDMHGVVAYYRNAVDVVPGFARYGPISFTTRGEIALGDDNPGELAFDASGPAERIPYLAQVAPEAQMRASALLRGPAGRYDARGAVVGASRSERLAGLFHVDAHGDGAFAPLLAQRADGSSLEGAFYLDRSQSQSAFWLDARRYRLAQSPQPPRLPGLPQWGPPEFSGRFDGVVGGAGSPTSFTLAGRLHGDGFATAGVPFDSVDFGVSGSPADLRVGDIRAQGPWGAFDGAGGYTADRLAVRGAYRGSFERLQLFTGDLDARGPLAGPLALFIEPGRTVVQTGGTRIVAATVHGAPLERLAGTIEVRNQRLQVDGATMRLAGGALAVAGSLAPGHRIGLSAARIDAAQLHGAGIPLQAGTVAALGGFSYEGGPRFRGSVLVGNARYGSYRLAGNGDVDFAGNRAHLGATEVLVGDSYGVLNGSLTGLGSHAAAYDLQVALRGADIATLVSLTGRNPWYLGGSLDADLHVGGAGHAPTLRGEVRVPEGTVNGLRFHDGSAQIDINAAYANVENGDVTVGSTGVAFAAGSIGDDGWMRLELPHADLSDFNDFFDAGDTLAGNGRILFDFARAKTATQTTADVEIQNLRYRRFPLGDAVAQWQTEGPNIDGTVSFGGAAGRLTSSGRIVLAHGGSLRTLLERSSYDVKTTVRGLDLGIWLPSLGYHLPITGRVDADGVVRGRYPALALTGNLSLAGGSLGKFPVDRLTISAVSNFERTAISDADLELPGLSLHATGSAALAPGGPIALTLRAGSPNLGAFASRLLGRPLGFSGTLAAQSWITGTRDHPHVIGGFDVEQAELGGVSVPSIVGSVGLDGHDAVLRDAELTLSKGSVALAGAIPFTVFPFGIGPSSAPVGLDLAVQNVDLGAFAPLLPLGSQIGGVLDGRMAVDGTAGAPRLRGELTLAQGSLLTPIDEAPLRNVSGKVDFGGSSIRLSAFHADAGTGTLDADGSAVVADLVHLTTNTRYAFKVRAAHATLDLPAFGDGIVDGTLTLSHAPGSTPLLAGSVTASDAVVPFSALYHPDAGIGLGGGAAPVPDLAFAIEAKAGRNVHVHSPNLDIGAKGSVMVGGTFAAPELVGEFTSTGGNLGYFNRVFRVIDGTVTFEPDLGIVPLLDARATTHVFDPASVTGSTDVTLTLTGPVTNLTIALDADEGNYDREQILALLLNAPELGTLIENGTVARSAGGDLMVGQEAFSVVNAQFTRTLLEPFESAFGQALGLSNLNFDLDYGGNVNVTARKLLGKSINAIYATNVSYPTRESFGFELRPNQYTSAQMTLYQTLGQTAVGQTGATYVGTTTNRTLLSVPSAGTNGFSFSFLRYLP